MKGRGCRVISDDKLKEVTPNADTKECYYIVDAVGVTEHEKNIPHPVATNSGEKRVLSLEHLLEHLAHNELSDDNMMLLRDYCASINRRYEDNVLFGRHLDYFISTYGFAPRTIADNIQTAFSEGIMVEYSSPSSDNSMRMGLIKRLMNNIPARKKLLEMQKGYFAETDGEDKVLYAGFSKESALSYIENFEKYLDDNKDSIEALRIIYNSEDIVITNSMLTELRDRLLSENRQYGVYQIWKNYKLIDEEGNVEELDKKTNVRALTNLIQIVRYAYGKNQKLTSLINGYARRFALYCGQNQRVLTEEQKNIMQRVAEYIIDAGAISIGELNEIDTDLWRKAVTNFDTQKLKEEMIILSKFLLNIKVA
jgi:type I restriction enzyme R subunit